MSKENQEEKIDKILETLAKPINRHILTILAGTDPGKLEGEMNSQNKNNKE